MRLRLQTESGLPSLKAWFSFHAKDEPTILDVKKSLCKSVKGLSDQKISSGDITFELEGFELLDELDVDGLLKEGDLVVIKPKAECSSAGKKRKAEEKVFTVVQSNKKRKEIHHVSSSRECSSSSPSSSDEDSSSEASSSKSESSSELESESDTSSSSSSAPSIAPIAPTVVKSQTSEQKRITNQVPPGHGSTQTHKRNQRRRLKKKYEAAAKGLVPPSVLPPKGTSSVNLAPLGPKVIPTSAPIQSERQQSHIQHEPQDKLNLSMFSLGNKNKKKGFKQASTLPSAQKKIIFETVASEPPLPFASALVPTPTHPPQPNGHKPLPRLISPSEKQEKGLLPSNMFVTSVDVEGDSPWKHFKKTKARKNALVQVDENPLSWLDDITTQREEEVEDEPIAPECGEPTVVNETAIEVDAKATLIWTVAENTFDTLSIIQKAEGKALTDVIRPGVVVGWKALALNPVTFCPEIMLHLATVLSPSPDLSTVSIRKMIRPGVEEYAEDDDCDEIVATETIFESGWKVINNIEA
ncbi:hypothetical protein WG66_005218 [Moniliophthora roreri]|uniref:Coilin n=1 Tax=Moniliophthora roreri TaxID=221103 RepID=A0A0W0FZV7_MONRR|nr:hypothetical protein WG66_005218 [Moniliophthora roreri]